MSGIQVPRIAGLVLLAGAILGFVGSLINPVGQDPFSQPVSPLFVPANWLILLGGASVILAFPSVYSRIQRRAGWLGLAGYFGMMSVAVMFAFFFSAFSLLLVPLLAGVQLPQSTNFDGLFAFFLTGSLLFLVGAICFGVAASRSRSLPSWPGYTLIVAAVLNLATGLANLTLPVDLTGMLVFVAMGGYGYELWRHSDRLATMPNAPGIYGGESEAA